MQFKGHVAMLGHICFTVSQEDGVCVGNRRGYFCWVDRR